MATKYARAVGGNWTTDATWSTTSGGAADTTKPTAADDAVIDAASGNVTIDSGAVCRSLDCNGYTGTLTHNSSVTLSIGDATAGAGNRALRFSAGMTYTISASSCALSFVSTSATQQTVDVGGKVTGNMQWGAGGVLGSYLLAGNLLANHASYFTTFTLNAGTLATGNYTITPSAFAIGFAGATTFTPGSSAINCKGAGGAGFACSASSLTVTANTATVTVDGAASGINVSNAVNLNGMKFVLNGSGAQFVTAGGAFTCGDVTRTGTAVKTDSLSISGPFTVTGTFTATGNSATNRVLVFSSVLGTARTITAAATTLTNVDFRDITGAGAATWSGTSVGNAGGNTSITTSPAQTNYWVGGTGNWSDYLNHWANSSGGTPGTGRTPLPQDTARLDASSGSGTITNDMPRIGGDLTCTGYTGTLAWSVTTEVYGSVTLASGMTLSGTNSLILSGRGARTVTSAGKTWTNQIAMNSGSLSNTYTLADAFASSYSGVAISCSGGHFLDGGFSVTLTGAAASVSLAGHGTTISGTWTIASTTAATPWTLSSATTTASSSTIVLSGATATDRTFAGGGKTYGTLTDQNTSTGKLTITGANTFGTINKTAAAACTLALPTSSGITVTNSFNVNGILGALLTLTGDVTKVSGNVICSYLNISSSDAAGGATFYAGRTSTDGGGNTGWLFVDYVTGTATGDGTGDGTAVGTRTVLGVATGDGTGDGSAIGTRIVLGVAEGSGSGDGTATGLRLVYGTATGSGEGSGLAIGGQVDPEGGLCGYWLHSDDLRPNGCTPCKSVTAESPSDDILNEAILAASEYLNAAVQFQFPGICENTVRPCGGEEGFGFGAGLFAWSQIPFYFPPGVFPLWWAGCGCAGACNCCGPPAFSLGKIPIVAVSEVKLDGEILEPEVDYTVVGDLLARLDPDGSGNDTWPACQNIALPDTEEGTFSVTFTWGAMPPSLGLAAARDLACLLVADACGEDCKPSERMVTRQAGGTTVQLISPDGDIRTSMPRTVKLFIDAFGPPKPSMRTFPKIRRPNSGTGVIVGPVDYGLGWQRGGWGAGCAGCG